MFDKCRIWSRDARAFLESNGHAIAHGFVPADLISKAFGDVDKHVCNMLLSTLAYFAKVRERRASRDALPSNASLASDG